MKQFNNETILLISKELFCILTVALAIFVILEIVWPGIVSAYININWVLIFWLVAGIVSIVINNKKSEKNG